MSKEVLTFELILHFDGPDGWEGTINELKQTIRHAVDKYVQPDDIEIEEIR